MASRTHSSSSATTTKRQTRKAPTKPKAAKPAPKPTRRQAGVPSPKAADWTADQLQGIPVIGRNGQLPERGTYVKGGKLWRVCNYAGHQGPRHLTADHYAADTKPGRRHGMPCDICKPCLTLRGWDYAAARKSAAAAAPKPAGKPSKPAGAATAAEKIAFKPLRGRSRNVEVVRKLKRSIDVRIGGEVRRFPWQPGTMVREVQP